MYSWLKAGKPSHEERNSRGETPAGIARGNILDTRVILGATATTSPAPAAPSHRSPRSSLRAIGQDDDDRFTPNDVMKSAGQNLALVPPAAGAVWEKIVQQAAHIGQVWDMTDLKADVEEMQVPSRGLVAAMGQTLAAIGQSLAPEVS